MTYLYSLLGDYLFPIIFMTELIEAILHGSSMVGYIPLGRKFNEGLVRFQFVVEAISIWCCFWHLDYNVMVFPYIINLVIKFIMGFHFIFHIINNFVIVVFVLDDFSKPFEGDKKKAADIILPWDFGCHFYNIFCLSLVIGLWQSIGASMMVGMFLYSFPKHLIYEKLQ